MKARDILGYSFNAVKLRKLRAGLTTLGIVIGITAIVALLTITQGLSASLTSSFQHGLAANTLIVVPGSNALGSSALSFGATPSISLYANYTDQIEALPSITKDLVAVIPVMEQPAYLTNSSGSTVEVTLIGVNFTECANAYPTTFASASGTIPLNPADNDVVVGAKISEPNRDGTIFVGPNEQLNVTTQVPIDNQTYVGNVTGVLGPIGGFSIGGPSDTGVYIPIEQAQKYFGTNQLSEIIVQLKNSDNATVSAVEKAITDHFNGQVTVISSTAIINTLTAALSTVALFLGGIAAISLLVAGVGILNIMIVSTIERTREIGILKALGMKSRTVMTAFLAESALIGLAGSVIGIILGWGLADIVAIAIGRGGLAGGDLKMTAILTPGVLMLALAFGIGVSVLFAAYPAWRASKLKVVEALRYE